mgnify:CR=1 FL=1|tara:strand:- start:152 stop:364 length:213 start_codon:yes stop_codon:yes gene_type:complete
MKVVFENQLTEETRTDLSVEQFTDQSVNISIDYLDLFNTKKRNHLGVTLDKKQLSNFIGALLHIQSKMRR